MANNILSLGLGTTDNFDVSQYHVKPWNLCWVSHWIIREPVMFCLVWYSLPITFLPGTMYLPFTPPNHLAELPCVVPQKSFLPGRWWNVCSCLQEKNQVAAAMRFYGTIASGALGSCPPVWKVCAEGELFPSFSREKAEVWVRDWRVGPCSPAASGSWWAGRVIWDRTAWVSLQVLPGVLIYSSWIIWNTNILGFVFLFCFKLQWKLEYKKPFGEVAKAIGLHWNTAAYNHLLKPL